MWCENQNGEWYWPLHPERQADHLRVWPVRAGEAKPGGPIVEWHAALVLDGDYTLHIEPVATADEAKRIIFERASLYLGTLAGSLAVQLRDPAMASLFNGSVTREGYAPDAPQAKTSPDGMTTRNQLIEGLRILEKCDPGAHGVCAEHDVIYGGEDSDAITAEDRKALEALGWHVDRRSGSWARFV